MTRPPTDPDGGWSEATSVAQGAPTDGARERQRRARNRRVWVLVLVVLLPFVTYGALLATGTSLPESDPPPALRVPGYVGVGVGFVLTIVGFIRLLRAKLWGQAWRSPVLSLNGEA